MTVTIFHNPACGTSRNTLAAIREAGIEPVVVEYLKAGWTRPQLTALLAKMGKTPRDALGLTSPDATDEQILDAMTKHPGLVERPIVDAPKGAVLARPFERVKDVL